MIMWIIVIASAIWVYFDARSIGVHKNLVSGFWNLGPFGWSVATLLLWIVGFPAYLIKRGTLKAAAQAERADADPAPTEEPASSPRSVAATSDAIASLEKLAELHERGILSVEEFEQKKQELLAS